VPLRHILTTYVNLCWVFGQFVGSGVLRGLLGRTDEWGYRIPVGVSCWKKKEEKKKKEFFLLFLLTIASEVRPPVDVAHTIVRGNDPGARV